MSGVGKRPAGAPPGPSPPPKRGPANEFDDLLEEADDMYADDDVPEAYMPDADDAAEPDLCEAGRNWLRPAPANLQPGCDALGEAQQLQAAANRERLRGAGGRGCGGRRPRRAFESRAHAERGAELHCSLRSGRHHARR